VLIVDDDPSHLEIYGLLLKQAGYEPVAALVRFTGADFPADPNINGIILDSRLNSLKTSSDLARQIRMRYPHAPIVLLSDVQSPAADIAPYVADSVRRGEPAELLGKLSTLVKKSPNQGPFPHSPPHKLSRPARP
jgi:DNA-binding NarL/FixJ family response regulator